MGERERRGGAIVNEKRSATPSPSSGEKRSIEESQRQAFETCFRDLARPITTAVPLFEPLLFLGNVGVPLPIPSGTLPDLFPFPAVRSVTFPTTSFQATKQRGSFWQYASQSVSQGTGSAAVGRSVWWRYDVGLPAPDPNNNDLLHKVGIHLGGAWNIPYRQCLPT